MMPPSPQGTVQEQLVRQYSYLFQMAQQLNVALGQLESGGTAAPSGGTAAPAAREQQYQTLKSMIVKTADTVQRRMDQLSAKLTGEYVAASEFGTYVERLNAYLEANPEALTQYYSFFADLQASTETVSAAFEQYRVETEGYIRTGIVCYDGRCRSTAWRWGRTSPAGRWTERRWWSRTTSGPPSLPASCPSGRMPARWRMCPTTGCISPTSRCWRA